MQFRQDRGGRVLSHQLKSFRRGNLLSSLLYEFGKNGFVERPDVHSMVRLNAKPDVPPPKMD
jgi:hypothetical protein